MVFIFIKHYTDKFSDSFEKIVEFSFAGNLLNIIFGDIGWKCPATGMQYNLIFPNAKIKTGIKHRA